MGEAVGTEAAMAGVAVGGGSTVVGAVQPMTKIALTMASARSMRAGYHRPTRGKRVDNSTIDVIVAMMRDDLRWDVHFSRTSYSLFGRSELTWPVVPVYESSRRS